MDRIQFENIDLKDRKILYLLMLNSRFSINTIAKLAGISRDVVNYRIEKMQERGLITLFWAMTNVWALGYFRYHIFIKLKVMTNEEEKMVRENLIQYKTVTWLAYSQGRLNLGVGLTTKSKEEMYLAINEVLKLFKGNLKEYYTFESLNEKSLATDIYLLDKEEIDTIKQKLKKIKDRNSFYHEITNPNFKEIKLDELDIKILKMLENNSRISLLTLSKELNMSPSTLYNRMKKLVLGGIIMRFSLCIAETLLGLNRSCVLLQVLISQKEKDRKFERFLESHPFIYYRSKVIGPWNLYLEILSKNINHFNEIMGEIGGILGEDLLTYENLNLLEELKCKYLPKE